MERRDSMQVQIGKVCIGNLLKVTKYDIVSDFSMEGMSGITQIGHIESENIPYKEGVPLIEIKKGKYVNLDEVVSFLDRMKLRKLLKSTENKKSILSDGRFILDTIDGYRVGDCIVQQDTVKPFYHTNFPEHTKSFRKINTELHRSIGTH